MHKSPHIREFSKNSDSYEKYSFLQKKIASELLKNIDFKPQKILDIGCGDGVVFQTIDWEIKKFVGIDLSKEMLLKHPKDKNVFLLEKDFDLLEEDYFKDFDMVVSSSSLQWSKNPYIFLEKLENNSKSFAVSIFCDKTFFDFRKFFNVDTFLPSSEKLISILSNDTLHTVKKYTLNFKDNLSMLRYIKKSGVSGGIKRTSVKNIRDFIKNYDKKELEFEVLFMIKNPQNLHCKN